MTGRHLRVILHVLHHSSIVGEHQDPHSYMGEGPQDDPHNVDEKGSPGTFTSLAVEPPSMEDFHLGRGGHEWGH